MPAETISRAQLAAEPKEVEIKFSVENPAVLEKAEKLFSLGRFRRIGSSRERQINRYWDTVDQRLHRARAILKLRQVGRRAEWTFKRELGYRAGISERIEISARASSSLRTIRRMLDREPFAEPVRRARQLIGRRPLQEILCLRTDRRIRRFATGRARLELALDRVGVLRSGRVAGSFQEIELENENASGPLYQEAVRDLRQRLGKQVRVSRTPKYVKGLRLLQWRR